jgi:23S rRNA (cytosine1962-C5)-methyltransferase
VFGETDGLPGLVLDRFGDVIVGQIGTAGMERLRERDRSEAVAKVHRSPRALIWKNAGSVRKLEALPDYADVALRRAFEGLLRVREGGDGLRQSTRSAGRRPAGSTTSTPTGTGSRRTCAGRACSTCSATPARGACVRRGFGASEVACVDASKPAIAAVTPQRGAERRCQDRVSAIEVRCLRFPQGGARRAAALGRGDPRPAGLRQTPQGFQGRRLGLLSGCGYNTHPAVRRRSR